MLEVIIPAIVGSFVAPVGAVLFNSVFNGKLIKFLGGLTKDDVQEFTTSAKVVEILKEENLHLESPDSSKLHIESGIWEFLNIRGPRVKGSGDFILPNRPCKDSKRITYNKPFKNKPKIVLGLSRIDTNNIFHNGEWGIPVNTRIIASAPEEEIGIESFNLNIETTDNSYIHVVRVGWIAYGV